MRTQLLVWGAVAGLLTAASCSKGPEPPRPGTPAFYWNAAKSTYHAGDFVKANENLQQILQTDNEFTARARPWTIVLSAGLAQGYAEAADAYEAGAKMNRANPMPFRKEMSALRTQANAAVLEFTETFHKYMAADKEPEVLLAFESPTGSAVEPPGLRKIFSGQLVQDSERDALVRAMIQRGSILTAALATGSPKDPAKLAETLKTGEAKVPRAQFLAGMAQELYDRSAIYGPTKLDLPNRTQMLCQEALDALQAAGGPETKQSKELTAKIQASLKKLKGNS
jgi:hypothetical protein